MQSYVYHRHEWGTQARTRGGAHRQEQGVGHTGKNKGWGTQAEQQVRLTQSRKCQQDDMKENMIHMRLHKERYIQKIVAKSYCSVPGREPEQLSY